VTSPKSAPSRRPRAYTHDPIRIRPSCPSPEVQGNSYNYRLAKCIPENVAVEHIEGRRRRRSSDGRSKPQGKAVLAFGTKGGRPHPDVSLVFGEITSAPATPVVTTPGPPPPPPPPHRVLRLQQPRPSPPAGPRCCVLLALPPLARLAPPPPLCLLPRPTFRSPPRLPRPRVRLLHPSPHPTAPHPPSLAPRSTTRRRRPSAPPSPLLRTSLASLPRACALAPCVLRSPSGRAA
jgi:hypothetical protein